MHTDTAPNATCATAAIAAWPSCMPQGRVGSRSVGHTLDEVADGGRAKAGGKRHRALGLDDLAEAADQALVVRHRVQLHARLDDVDRAQGTVRDAAADATGQRTWQAKTLEYPVGTTGL